MTFANLSTPWVLAGLAGLAALLYALQHLRTRYREVTVVTTLFWRQVVDVAPVRKFWERFRHVWAYALILAICSLIWIAVAEPQFEDTRDRTFHVVVLDGSAGMAGGARFQDTVRELKRHVSRLPADRRQVIWSGAQIRPLLNPGEHDLVLDRRLAPLVPEAAPASLERVVRQLSASQRGGHPTSVLVFGDAPVRKQVLDLLPPAMTAKRAASPGPAEGNRGITALGASEALSGAWNKVDVFVRAQATKDGAPIRVGDLQFDLDGRAVAGAEAVAPETGAGFVIHDLPAGGGLLTVRLSNGDGLPLDDAASLRLPDKPILKVLVSPSLAPVLRPALEADPGVTLTSADPDVVIRHAGEGIGGSLPAMEFVSATAQAQAFLFTHPDTLDSAAVFTDAVNALGLKQIDAMSLAQVSQRPIEVSIAGGRQWRFSVWQELLSDDYNFTQSRAFPLFVASAVRWLAGTSAWYPYVAAGQPLTTTSTGERPWIVGAGNRVLDPLGVAFVPARAGQLTLESGGKPLSVSLLDPEITTGERDPALPVATAADVRLAAPTSLVTWLLLLAVAMLGAEWFLYQKGRMP
jgi:hypothetical protein